MSSETPNCFQAMTQRDRFKLSVPVTVTSFFIINCCVMDDLQGLMSVWTRNFSLWRYCLNCASILVLYRLMAHAHE